MPARKSTPTYRLHKPTGQAVVTIGGHDYYLGKHGTTESLERYNARISRWFADGQRAEPEEPAAGVSVGELAAAYLDHAKIYYRRPDGTHTPELVSVRYALRPLLKLFIHLPAADFTPLKLQAVRKEMITARWVRTNINRQINRIRRMFNWAVAQELIKGHNLDKVAGLKAGRSEAAEADPKRPVPAPMIDAVLPLVSAQVRAMIELQRLTGMRPAETCTMRTADIDTSGKIWAYSPTTHKNSYRGHARVIHIGPRAQEILRPWLRADLQAFLFSPAEAEASRAAALAESRKSPRAKSIESVGAQGERGRAPTDRYTVDAYRRAIKRACDRAFELPADLAEAHRAARKWVDKKTYELGRMPKLKEMPPEIRQQRDAVEAYRSAHRWHPHRLRHNAGTELRALYGLEAARAVLGHKSISATEIYAELNQAKSAKIMGEVG